MALKDDLPTLSGFVKDNEPFLDLNNKLFEIIEGNLLEQVLADLRAQLSPKSFATIKWRVAPINVLRRVVDKLSKIYAKPPIRLLLDSNKQPVTNKKDIALFEFYLDEMDFNPNMDLANQLFNTYKGVSIEPFIENESPGLRIIPYDRFLYFSKDLVDPVNPTHYIRAQGKMAVRGQDKKIFFVFTDEEFLIIDEGGEVKRGLMREMNQTGLNPFGTIPAVYINHSKHLIVPRFDHDMLQMTKLIPILLSDLNFAVMFQAFSIIWGIDIDFENLNQSPNAFWNIKSDKNSENKPQIGQIKPEVDIDAVIKMIISEFSMWLNSKSIRPGSVGNLSSENISSGISKMVDEMDTFEARQNQIPFFVTGEEQLWDKIINNMHPTWVRQGQLRLPEFTSGTHVRVVFPEQIPLLDRTKILSEIEKEMGLGLMTQTMAMKRLDPEISDQEIKQTLEQVRLERTMILDTSSEPDGENT